MSQGSIYVEMVSNQTIALEVSAEPLIEDRTLPNVDLEKGPMSAEEPVASDRILKKREDAGNQLPEVSSSTWTLAKFVYGLNRDDDLLIIGGLAFSILAGSSYPSRVNFWCWMYLMIGFTTLIGWLGQSTCFAYYSQRLTHKAREKGLDTVLHHDMAAFLRQDHSTGFLTTVLSSSASSVQGLSGVVLGTILVILTQLTAGFVVAAAVGWKLALVCFSTVPIQIGCGILRLKCLSLLESHSRRIYESSANYACEYSANIRTVAPLTLERKIQKDYHEILEMQRKKSLLSVTHSSLLYAASQSLNLLCVALAFWYGSRLVATDSYSLFQFFLCYTAVIAGAYSAGAIFSFAPDIGKAKDAAQAMKNLFDWPIDIDARSDRGASLRRVDGSIHFQDVSFCYPNRPGHLVLDRVKVQVQPGQYVAVVGASGSGKSTIVSLLERFFDPTDGHVMVDGMDLRNWNVKNYRGHIALVSQTPTLFDGTIRENIVLGVENDNDVAEDDITRACRDANILDFINSLPTRVGTRGAMLSGGQKQRIAIARALIRSPQILLLDEATSALDSESERVVQAALDAASKGRTTIAIAHRISTVEKADCIYGDTPDIDGVEWKVQGFGHPPESRRESRLTC
nr:abc transporter fmpd [Quercus suber]POE94737.1 abc transporter fmpd [Quercus suber]